ncbi:MAG: HEAT repeat domain-containing protein [Phycisphaeraceae bacterium]
MPPIRDLLPAILAQRSQSIDQALSDALPHAEADELGDLGYAMIQRGKANGVESLIAEYHRLPRPLQNKLVEQAERFSTSIRRAAGRQSPRAPANALAIIEKAASTRLAYLVTALCRHPEPVIREQAGRCLVAMAVRAISSSKPDEPTAMDAVSARFLLESVEQAVVLYSRHDQTDLLTAVFWLLPRPMPEAFAALGQPEHSSVEPMRELLTRSPDRASRRALVPLVGVHPLADACREALAQANENQQLGEALEMGHLLCLPSVRSALRRVRDPQTHWPDAQQHQEMPSLSRRWLPAYLHALTDDPQEEVIRLAPIAQKSDTATRLAVLRRLLSIARLNAAEHRPAAENAKDTLAIMTRDTKPAIARTALWHLIQTDYAGLPRILADLVNSKHDSIRHIAAKHLAPLGFDRFWSAWPKLDPKRRIAAGKALIKIDQDFHRHLGGKLASRDPDARVRALVVIATLNQGLFFEEALLELCTSDDPRIVATAVKALAGCTSKAAKQTLEHAMQHADTRIRANAIEAISHTQAADNLDKLLQMSQDPEQRPRANAIKALLELRAKDALPSLTRMLGDQRPEHRISALWLIDELGILQLARLVAEISLNDQDEKVKQRASRVIQHLIEDLEHQSQLSQHSARDAGQPTEAA